jgi:hypothetical protein
MPKHAKSRRPTNKNEVWLHVDRFDKQTRDVWAVQFYDHRMRAWRYLVRKSEEIFIESPPTLVDFSGTAQPRAVIWFGYAVVNEIPRPKGRPLLVILPSGLEPCAVERLGDALSAAESEAV